MLSIHNNCNKLCIGLFYRPPNSLIDVLDNFCTTLECLDTSRFSNFILLGDFNIDFYNPTTSLHSKLTNLTHSLSLTQVIQDATHISTNGKESLIDLAFVSQPQQVNHYEVIPPISNSDHNGFTLNWNWKSTCNLRTRADDVYGDTHMQTLTKQTSCYATQIGTD